MNSVTPVDLATRSQRTAANPAASVWVSASAGSGKTKVLTDRVLALLLTGTSPERILCLTFTKAAAAEMSNRITQQLADWVTLDEHDLTEKLEPLYRGEVTGPIRERARRLFARVLDTPGGLRISTIHAFCQSLLQRFPLEAGVAPHFAVMDERNAAEALFEAQEATIEHARSEGDIKLADALAFITARVHEVNFAPLMESLIAGRGKLAQLLDRYGTIDAVMTALRRKLGLGADETESSIISAACHDDAFGCDNLKRVVAAMSSGKKTDQERANIIAAWLANATQRTVSIEVYADAYLTEGEVRARLVTKEVIATVPDALEVLQAEAERLRLLMDRVRAARVAAATESLLRLGADLLTRYRADKERRGILDYDDLIQVTRALLHAPGLAGWVLYKLDGGLDHILVDEGQDTNPDQWAIVDAIAAEFFTGLGRHEESSDKPRTVFVVGDRKQSIYSFQGASPDEFERMRGHMRARVKDTERKWEDIPMNVSFRSAPAVLKAVDLVFQQPAARDGVALPDEGITHLTAREGDAGLVEVWPPVEPAATDVPVSWKPPVERTTADSPPHRLAALVAKRIAKMIQDRELLPSQNRPIRAGDIMVLVRRRTGFVEELVRQLKRKDIAVAGVDRMVLTQQIPVMDLIAVGQFLLLPEDDLTLATVLKSPLVGLSEDDLFTLAYNRDGKHLWEVLIAHGGTHTVFGKAYDLLTGLLAKVDFLTPAQLYAEILVTLDGRRKLLSRLGFDADDPIDEFMELTLVYERAHPPSLQGFLHWLAAGDTEIKRDLDQTGADAVRIITVHGAKGLQAPIVFLPDTLRPPVMQESLLWTDDGLLLWSPTVGDMDSVSRRVRDEAQRAQEREYRRLLYVAMTRAEDRLYVCGWQTKRPTKLDACWHTLIKNALATVTGPVTDDFLAADGTLPTAEILRLASPQTRDAKSTRGPTTAAPLEPLPDWARRDPPREENPPRPLAPSRGATESAALSPLSGDGRVRFQRGLIIHRLLQSLPDIPSARRRAAAAAYLARPTWGLDDLARAQIVDETMAVLETPAFAPLFGPGSHAEVPLTGLVGTYAVSGQVDRLAVSATDVWIIDYKTNRPPPRAARDVDAAYVFQMATYRAALQVIYPRHRIHCVLLWTDGPFTMELTSEQLDQALRHTGLI